MPSHATADGAYTPDGTFEHIRAALVKRIIRCKIRCDVRAGVSESAELCAPADTKALLPTGTAPQTALDGNLYSHRYV